MNPFAEVGAESRGVSDWGREFWIERARGTVSMCIDGAEIRMTQAEAKKLSVALRKVASQEKK